MCRLFGMTGGTHEVQATFWLLDAATSLVLQSENQPDGVGLGTFDDDGNPEIWKKPTQANRSETFITGAQKVRSRTFLAHIRHATATDNTLENTHPFEQHCRVFAHNGIVGDLEEIRRRLGPAYTELMKGETDSEHYFTMVTKAIDDAGGDVGAGITAAAQEIASDLALYSLNMILATPTDLWALRYPETNELYILERSVGGFNPADGFDERSSEGMRIQAHELSFLPAAVIASERMNANPAWRLLESGELIHIDSELNVTSTMAVPFPPAHMIDLEKMTAREAIAQGEEPVAEAG